MSCAQPDVVGIDYISTFKRFSLLQAENLHEQNFPRWQSQDHVQRLH